MLPWKINKYYILPVCVCSLSYSKCKACVPYHVWPVWPWHILRHHLMNGTIFGRGGGLNMKCVFTFFTTFAQNIPHSENISARYYHKRHTSPRNVQLVLSDFDKTWNFSTDLKKKKSWIQSFTKIRLVGAEQFHADRQTDRHDETHSRFSKFCERSEKLISASGWIPILCNIIRGTTQSINFSSYIFRPMGP